MVIPPKRRHSYMALGEFARPRQFARSGNVRVLDVVAQAGGLKSTASGQLLILRGSLTRHRVWRIPFQDVVALGKLGIDLDIADLPLLAQLFGHNSTGLTEPGHQKKKFGGSLSSCLDIQSNRLLGCCS